MPDGGMEDGEALIQAIEREVREETGYIVHAKRLVGAYSSTHQDDLVLSIDAFNKDIGVMRIFDSA